jgi:hypothetical protein
LTEAMEFILRSGCTFERIEAGDTRLLICSVNPFVPATEMDQMYATLSTWNRKTRFASDVLMVSKAVRLSVGNWERFLEGLSEGQRMELREALCGYC